ncbi:MAG TPA: rhodanese-like domain-containing protein [Verrucomicrobiota bacterium]|jgi:phage shock protein E|nr:rhodanese-like domain-containing protein [Verrucomicrobiota bacterium]HRT09596.1 rhodanese-like domain-containing protein [Candidatus Paceibacterota bacterium]HRT58369.1 rhodanese-like domain-containing protein [Candidatus Paceibacterota bacterium]
MDWTVWIVAAAVVAAFFAWKRLALVSPREARAWLAKGARIIDVRTPGEYQSRHVPGAINVPLGDLSGQIGRHAPDKTQPLLVYCLSGGRSGVAQSLLKRAGYQHVFNLGSYGRAEKIVTGGR